MKRNILMLGTVIVLFFMSCCGNTQRSNQSDNAPASDEIVTSSLTNAEGVQLVMSFNNTKGTASITFKGEVIDLNSQKPASGIWYKNDQYELRGKGQAVELSKDGQVVFSTLDKE
jgi:membrane-bound inhibitor of C-type lysozyme